MPIEIYQAPDGQVRFYFSHSDEHFTTGVMVLQPGTALPKHNRPLAFENLTQISGACLMTLFDANNTPKDYELTVGEGIRLQKGQWHIHANPYKETSITLFIAEGSIVEIMQALRETYQKITTNIPKNIME